MMQRWNISASLRPNMILGLAAANKRPVGDLGRRHVRSLPPRRVLALVTGVAFLMLGMLGTIISVNPEAENTGEGNALRQGLYAAVFLLAVAATRPLEEPRRLLAVPLSLVLALGWCWLSLSWAIDPDIAMRRLMLTTIVVWTVFLIVTQLGYLSTITIMRTTLVAILLINYIVVMVWPSFGIHQVELVGDSDPNLIGNWRGVTPHKNFVGAICAFTIFIFILDARSVPKLWRLSVMLATAYFLYRSASKTSMGLLVISLISAWFYLYYNPAYRTFYFCALVALGAVVPLFLYGSLSPYLAFLQDPAALTGRGQIWPALLAYSQEHWWLGSGYGSFWNIGSYSPIYHYATGWVTEITTGHNGYLDLLVQIGFPGLLLAIYAAIIAPLIRLLVGLTAPRQQGALLVSFLVFCAGHNLTESSLLDRDTTPQIFLMFAIALTGQVKSLAIAARRSSRYQVSTNG